MLVKRLLIVFLGIMLCGSADVAMAQSMGINNPNPDPSSILDLTATNRGLLIPRMTTAQRNAISAPANGLQIINTTTGCLDLYWGGVWNAIGCACSGPPSAPSSNAASNVQQNQFTANWLASSGATNYYLDVATDASFTSMVSGYSYLGVGNVTGYNVTGLTCNTTYYYRVWAENNCGTSAAASGTITVTTSTSAGPVAIAATGVQQNQFTANWNALSGATGYYLDVATDASFTSMVSGYSNASVGNVTSATVSGLTCGTTYYYRIRANTACGVSSNSNTISQVTLASPTAPVATSATGVQQQQFTANWGSVANATTYYLDVATDAGFTTFVPGYNNQSVGLVTSYNVSGLACNTNYYFRVRAGTGCGTSSNSNSITTLTCACNPTILAATNVTSGGLTANWASAGGATSYFLEVSDNTSFTSPLADSLNVGNVTSYNVTGLNCNTTYYYRVKAVSSCGSTTYSSYTSATTLSASAPVATAATSTQQTQFTANWNTIGAATAYYLEVATSNTFGGSDLAGYNPMNMGTSTSATIAPLSCNTTYYYHVKADNTCGSSGYGNTIMVNTCVCTPTTKPAGAIQNNGFDAKWNPVANATGYYLDVSTDPAFGSFVTGYNNLDVGNVTTYTVTGLACNTTYYYQVRAYSSCGTSPSSDSTVVTTSNTALSATTTTAATGVTSTGFTANWTAVSGATDYILDVATDNAFTSPITGSPFTMGSPVTSYTISGLPCGNTTYYYRVRVVNGCGTSGNSNTTITATTAVYSVPITLTNSQASATQANFQQMLIVNSSTYSSYENASLMNVEFTTGIGATGTQLQAWIESGATSASTSTRYWINLGSSVVPAGGTLTIYMNFMSSNVMSATGPTGEAPQLSGTYAQYDNGSLVFGFYNNFAGNTVDGSVFSQIIPGGGTSINQNNGVKIKTNGSTRWGGLISINGYASSPTKVFDGDITAVSGVAAGMALQIGNTATSGSIDFNFWGGSVATGTMQTGMTNNDNPNLQVSNGIMGGAWVASNSQVWYTNYAATSGTQSAYTLPATIYPSLGIFDNSSNSEVDFQWIRTHIYAPSGVMPTTSLGSVTCN